MINPIKTLLRVKREKAHCYENCDCNGMRVSRNLNGTNKPSLNICLMQGDSSRGIHGIGRPKFQDEELVEPYRREGGSGI